MYNISFIIQGLVAALDNLVPAAEHRFCVMHLYRNMPKEFKSTGVKKLFWFAARATTDYYFNRHMLNLSKVYTKLSPYH